MEPRLNCTVSWGTIHFEPARLAGGDPVFTEGSVGRSYLAEHGVPPEAVVVEREGGSTAQSIATVAEIMRRMNLKSAIAVSDGYHIFRVKKMLAASRNDERHAWRVCRRQPPAKNASCGIGVWVYTEACLGIHSGNPG
jgi:hypothetical protein